MITEEVIQDDGDGGIDLIGLTVPQRSKVSIIHSFDNLMFVPHAEVGMLECPIALGDPGGCMVPVIRWHIGLETPPSPCVHVGHRLT